jgi:hypothetical protein
MAIELPSGETQAIELDLGPAELRRARATLEAEERAPGTDESLARYLVYLGSAYVEAERIASTAASVEAAYRDLNRLFGAVSGRASVLRFHYAEQARAYAEEQRAHVAHERLAGGFEVLTERMQAEIAIREERLRRLRAALGE